jgi:hypothetical protein
MSFLFEMLDSSLKKANFLITSLEWVISIYRKFRGWTLKILVFRHWVSQRVSHLEANLIDDLIALIDCDFQQLNSIPNQFGVYVDLVFS